MTYYDILYCIYIYIYIYTYIYIYIYIYIILRCLLHFKASADLSPISLFCFTAARS